MIPFTQLKFEKETVTVAPCATLPVVPEVCGVAAVVSTFCN